MPHRLAFGSTEFHVITPDEERLHTRYLLHFLRQENVRHEGERKMTGSAGQRRIPEHFLANLSVPLPSLSEQQRIAEVLDRVEALQEQRLAASFRLDQLPLALFAHHFGDPVENARNWERVSLADVLDEIESGHSPNCHDRPASSQEWGVLKLGAITWCQYDEEQNKALPAAEAPDARLEVKAGDLLFARKNTYELVAACAYVHETRRKLLIPDLIFRLRLRSTAPVDPVYLHQLLIHPRKRREIQRLASGSAGSMPNISKARLRTAIIELPPLALQREYSRKILAWRQLHVTSTVSMKRVHALFSSLQHRAFRGEL